MLASGISEIDPLRTLLRRHKVAPEVLHLDRSTRNLPSRDFDATLQFYSRLGFEGDWRDDRWMILRRGDLVLEFFPYPDLSPAHSWFSCCLRLDNLAALYRICIEAGVPEVSEGYPRLHPPQTDASGQTMAALIDCDGTLLRLIENDR